MSDIKKSWEAPKLCAYGEVESLTQANFDDAAPIAKFITLGQEFGLLASLEI